MYADSENLHVFKNFMKYDLTPCSCLAYKAIYLAI